MMTCKISEEKHRGGSVLTTSDRWGYTYVTIADHHLIRVLY